MKKMHVIFCLILIAATSFSQQKDPFVEFRSKTHDFGKINESSGLAVNRFEFKNAGNTPVIVTNVKTTCGCTTPSYSKAPVLPGETGYIDVTYNPKNRPGPFDKYITVYSNAVNNPVKINIKGFVIGALQENLENPQSTRDKYKFPMGSVELTTNHVAFSQIDYREISTKSFGIYNSSPFPVNISFDNLPKHLKVQSMPAILKPGEEGEVVVTYDAVERNDWGFVFDRINLVLDGETTSKGAISVSANIVENFEGLTGEERANAPAVNFKNKYYDFDTIPKDTMVVCRFMFENTGKSDLIVRKVKASCGCTASHAGDNVLAPGEDSYIEAKFNAKGRSGLQSKSITVVTNDPDNSSIVLKFSAYIDTKGK